MTTATTDSNSAPPLRLAVESAFGFASRTARPCPDASSVMNVRQPGTSAQSSQIDHPESCRPQNRVGRAGDQPRRSVEAGSKLNGAAYLHMRGRRRLRTE